MRRSHCWRRSCWRSPCRRSHCGRSNCRKSHCQRSPCLRSLFEKLRLFALLCLLLPLFLDPEPLVSGTDTLIRIRTKMWRTLVHGGSCDSLMWVELLFLSKTVICEESRCKSQRITKLRNIFFFFWSIAFLYKTYYALCLQEQR